MEQVTKKRPRGRPPLSPDEKLLEPVMIRLPHDIMRRLEAIQASRLDRPTKSAIVRELLAKALGSYSK